MRSLKWIAIAVLSSGVAMSAAAAQAADFTNCMQMAQQVKTALADNPQSPGYADALKAQINGRDFCSQGLYDQGVSHYAHALTYLGTNKS
jgi:hypothetical protein